MFAKTEKGALCIEDYKTAKKGYGIPKTNKMYLVVEEWLESNEWAEVPDSFFDVELTTEQKLSAREFAYSSRSDKFFLEAMRKEAQGDTEGAAEAKALGLAEVELIKAEFPIN